MSAEVLLRDEGTIILFIPMTEEALSWLEENTVDGPWFSGALAVERRYAPDLAAGMEGAGFSLGPLPPE